MYGGSVKIIKLNTQISEKTGYTAKDTSKAYLGTRVTTYRAVILAI
jgi:hypothetical protein